MKGTFVTLTPEDWKEVYDYVKATAVANFDNAERLVSLKQAVLRAKVMDLEIDEPDKK